MTNKQINNLLINRIDTLLAMKQSWLDCKGFWCPMYEDELSMLLTDTYVMNRRIK